LNYLRKPKISLHKNPKYQAPELLVALEAHRLPTDFPSQNADGFRLGWMAAKFSALGQRDTNSGEKATQDWTLHADKGEAYAGITLNEDGTPSHYLILTAIAPTKMNWQEANDWAGAGNLPNKQESALLYANCKNKLPKEWVWTSTQYSAFSAWPQSFCGGYQYIYYKDSKLSAVAVRRLYV
jgi:hypothetical protein